MELQGLIVACLAPTQGESRKNPGEKWFKQVWVIEHESGQYPKKCAFSIFGNKEKFDRLTAGLAVGKRVAVQIDIDASEYDSRWYNEIRAWDIKDLAEGNTEAGPTPSAPVEIPADVQQIADKLGAKVEPVNTDPFASARANDDLPF